VMLPNMEHPSPSRPSRISPRASSMENRRCSRPCSRA
jgi:hypothetical protein